MHRMAELAPGGFGFENTIGAFPNDGTCYCFGREWNAIYLGH